MATSNRKVRKTSVIAHALTARRRALGARPDHESGTACGVDASTFQRWRSGAVIPPDDKAPALADYLNVTVDEVYALLEESRASRPRRTRPPGIDRRLSDLENQVRELSAAVARLEVALARPPAGSSRQSRK